AHAERSRRLQQIFQSQNIYPQKICDVGGMDGQIMSQFSDSKRYVYDKVPKKENNFCIYLQSSDDLASNAPYDLIIFSHVLEHVPDPHDFLAPLKQYLSPQGCFYFEVPLQYQGSYLKKRGIPLGCHVNYFTMPSLKQLSVDIGMSHIQFFRKEIVWYDELKVAALKVICKASTMNNKTVFFWPWEIFQDTYLHYKARSK